jgi:hemerythrin HHE cation binding domain-containing protein
MMSPDIVDVLLDQHDQMRHLCAAVDKADGADKVRLFARLGRPLSLHELSDRRVVHPATRNSTREGDRVGVACMVEDRNIKRGVAELLVLGVGDVAFDGRFTRLRHAIADHTAHEERDEFSILRRYVTTSRLHMMVGEVRDVQTMGAA